MISKDKKYKTRDGRDVRIYATDGKGNYPIHGAIKSESGGWIFNTWNSSGRCFRNIKSGDNLDLIEVEEDADWTTRIGLFKEISPQSNKHPTILSLTQHGNTITIQHPDSDIDAEELSEMVVSLLRGSGYGDVLLTTLIETLEQWTEE